MNSETLKKLKPYVLVFIGYIAVVVLLLWFVDSVVMPWIVNNKTVTVPNIEGLSLSSAQSNIYERDLALKITQEIYSMDKPAGTILSQKPMAGTTVKEGRVVFVTVSKGKRLVKVPYLQLLSLREAEIALSENDLELGKVEYDNSETVNKDLIISQSIGAGEQVLYGTSVNVVLSKGPVAQIQVPNLVGKTFDEAKLILDEVGLTMGLIHYKVNETYQQDIILEQTPVAGETVVPDTPINIILSK